MSAPESPARPPAIFQFPFPLYFLLIIRGVKMPEKEVEIDKTDAFLKIAKMDEGGNLIVAPGG
jgi:hypothetical protein